MEQKIEGFGWGYEFDSKPFQDNLESIKTFGKEHGLSFSEAFLLAFFHYYWDSIEYFQKEMGYFPFDGCSSICQKFIKEWSYQKSLIGHTFMRNQILDELVQKGYLKRNGQMYIPINNPYQKIVNRYNNLNILLTDK